MPNFETTYMGLKLKNPLIVASSGLTKSVGKIEACAEAGAGAVVVKSLFEEILGEDDARAGSDMFAHTEAYDYMMAEVHKQYGPQEYCDLINEAKKRVDIPVIASINCVSDRWWPKFASQIAKAGADGLELNVFPMVSNAQLDSVAVDKLYFNILDSVQKVVDLPLAMKLSMHFTALPNLAAQLARKGLKALVMFNRFVEPDIDIHKLQIKSTFPFSEQDNIKHVLRWIALLSGRVKIDYSATTGIHTSESIIKLLLAGASTVQLASVLYRHGFKKINILLKELSAWMDEHQFEAIDDFRGKLNYAKVDNPDIYLRSQFMERIREVE